MLGWPTMKHPSSSSIALLLASAGVLFATEPQTAAPAKQPLPAASPAPAEAIKKPEYMPPTPTEADVPYGSHPKQVLHFWKAEASAPTPLIFFIHGGGWGAGNRTSGLASVLPSALKNGISVVSVEYRFVSEATADGVVPPVKGPMFDAARALQFVRSKAKEWNIDKSLIGASGGSAGACTSLWLAFHDDLADPKSEDPIARESTRLACAAVSGPQTTLDPAQMKEWTPNSTYGAHAFGIKGDPALKQSSFDAFLEAREKILPWIMEYSPYALVSAGDPAVGLYFNNAPAIGEPAKDPTHTANFGVKLKERCDALKVECELVYPGAEGVKNASAFDFLLARLKR
jgi:acetyl esterase/lipase